MPPSHLIVVCCHGIWLGGPCHGRDESTWLIADFQKGETPTFIQHIRTGIECLAHDPQNSVLVFSGGPTRRETHISEAQSYADIARANDYFGLNVQPRPDNILTEDRALDSYQNILFSLTLFYAHFGAWPAHLTVVSHSFKRSRLVDGHCAAIGWPLNRVTFRGIDPTGMAPGAAVEKANSEALKGVARAIGEWAEDPYGRGESLRGKREARNPWGVWQGIFAEEEAEARVRSGLVTRGLGGDETLNEGAVRPWSSQ